MKRFKHFLIGVLAVVVPAAVSVIGSPTVQHFIAAHPVLSAYLPIASGVIVQLYHHFGGTTTAPAAKTAAK